MFSPLAAARRVADDHAARAPFSNLYGDLAPATVEDAYAVQEALQALWEPIKGPVAGLKIATTTKVMQALMGIEQPCGGMIYARTIQPSPGRVKLSDHRHVVVECELAVRLARDLPARSDLCRSEVLASVGEVMPAFELIEDRDAVYRETKALSLIADNAWNAGVVLGPGRPVPSGNLDGLRGRLTAGGLIKGEGRTDDPLGALAWVANLAAARGRPMTTGMIVITGSLIPTLAIAPGERFHFDIDGLGSVELHAEA